MAVHDIFSRPASLARRSLLAVAALVLFTSVAEANVCERELSAASEKYGVPLGVLYAVGLTETGRKGKLYPYALNIEGRTVFARDLKDAMAEFRKARKQGKTLIDLGCMQVNHYYHGKEFASPEEMFVPAKNVTYAAQFLKQLHAEHGTWTHAVARYHASERNTKAQKRYICSVIRNLVASGFGSWTAESKDFCGKK